MPHTQGTPHGRRWYRLRPKNSKRWMALGWFVLLIVVAFPFPGWW
jgi:hypothetical protein